MITAGTSSAKWLCVGYVKHTPRVQWDLSPIFDFLYLQCCTRCVSKVNTLSNATSHVLKQVTRNTRAKRSKISVHMRAAAGTLRQSASPTWLSSVASIPSMQSIEQKLEISDHPTGVLSICGICSQEALERAYMGDKPRPVRLSYGGAGFTHWSKKYLSHDWVAGIDGAILCHLRAYYLRKSECGEVSS